MSEAMTRAQFLDMLEEIAGANTDLLVRKRHQCWLDNHDAALRQEIERLTNQVKAMQETQSSETVDLKATLARVEGELTATRHQLRDTANERNQAEQGEARLLEKVKEFENWLASLPYKP